MFNPTDFKSVAIEITFRNLTSRAQPLPLDQVSVLEVRSDGMVLAVPANCCNIKHSIDFTLVHVDPVRKDAPLKIQGTGRIVEVEKTDEPSAVRVTVLLLQYEESEWTKLLDLIAERQLRVNEFLRQSQG